MFTILHVSVAVTDGIWMFNTASGCHSVADVIAGIVCTAIAYEVMEYAKFRILEADKKQEHLFSLEAEDMISRK